jgi:hypothetical protein
MDVMNELLIKLIHRGYGHGFALMIMHGAVLGMKIISLRPPFLFPSFACPEHSEGSEG